MITLSDKVSNALSPIEEQQRIVERLDMLLPLCDDLNLIYVRPKTENAEKLLKPVLLRYMEVSNGKYYFKKG